jgi:hypothetical protein
LAAWPNRNPNVRLAIDRQIQDRQKRPILGTHGNEKPAGYGGFSIAETNGPSSGADRAGASLKERYSRSYGAPLDTKTSTLRLLALLNLDRNQK